MLHIKNHAINETNILEYSVASDKKVNVLEGKPTNPHWNIAATRALNHYIDAHASGGIQVSNVNTGATEPKCDLVVNRLVNFTYIGLGHISLVKESCVKISEEDLNSWNRNAMMVPKLIWGTATPIITYWDTSKELVLDTRFVPSNAKINNILLTISDEERPPDTRGAMYYL